MTKEKNEKQNNIFEIEVYACNGDISGEGYSSLTKEMIYFNYGNGAFLLRGNSELLAKSVASDLENKIRKNSGVQEIVFIFPEIKKSFSQYADGFFGRPEVCVGATFVKPLSKKRKNSLANQINKIPEINDRWGNKIKLTA